MKRDSNYSLLSDAAGVLFWCAAFAAYTSPVWLPIVAFAAGVYFGLLG